MALTTRSRLRFECTCGQPASILITRTSVRDSYILEGLNGRSVGVSLGNTTTGDILKETRAACMSCGRELEPADLKSITSPGD